MEKAAIIQHALFKAINYFGSRRELAKAIGVKVGRIGDWIKNRSIPLKYVEAIDYATRGAVSRYNLDPDVRLQPKKEWRGVPPINLSISQRISLGGVLEKNTGKRQGKRNDLVVKDDNTLLGKTRDWVAKELGFNSHTTYARAKYVVHHGLYDLVQKMDSGTITITAASRIAALSPDEQEAYLQKTVCAALPILHKTSDNPLLHTLQVVTREAFKCKQSLCFILTYPPLIEIEKKHTLRLALSLLSLVGQSDHDGCFPWESDTLGLSGFEEARDMLADIGLVSSVQRAQKRYGQFVLYTMGEGG